MPVQQLIWDGLSPTRPTDRYAAPDGADWNEITRQLQNCQAAAYGAWLMPFGQAMLEGTLVYMAGGIAFPAQADTLAHADAVGLAGAPGQVHGSGRYTLENWFQITGSILLVPGAIYFLSPFAAGTMTTTPPTVVGQFVTELGRAMSEHDFDVNIKPPVGL